MNCVYSIKLVYEKFKNKKFPHLSSAVFKKTDDKEMGNNETLPVHAKSFISLGNIVFPKFQVNLPFSNMLNTKLQILG